MFNVSRAYDRKLVIRSRNAMEQKSRFLKNPTPFRIKRCGIKIALRHFAGGIFLRKIPLYACIRKPAYTRYPPKTKKPIAIV